MILRVLVTFQTYRSLAIFFRSHFLTHFNATFLRVAGAAIYIIRFRDALYLIVIDCLRQTIAPETTERRCMDQNGEGGERIVGSFRLC